MGYQTGLPAALRARGLTVEVVDGWKTRGSSVFDPEGAVCHWTAGAPAGDRPSLRVVTAGHGTLPGPLCNVFLSRAGVAVVVAAGRANHAGVGGWRGLEGNGSVFGTEAESTGAGDWTDAQRWAYPRVNAAFCDLGGFGPDMVCGHNEWAPTRKIDIRDWDMARMRRDVAAVLEGDDMPSLDEIRDAVWKSPVTNRAGEKIAVGAFIQSLPDEVADEVWTRPMPGLDGKQYTVGATVLGLARNAHRGATDAAIARRLAEEAAKGRVLSDEQIARLADEVAERVELVSAADVAAHLSATTTATTTITPKEPS